MNIVSCIMNGILGPVQQDACMWLSITLLCNVGKIHWCDSQPGVGKAEEKISTNITLRRLIESHFEAVFVPGTPSYSWLALACASHTATISEADPSHRCSFAHLWAYPYEYQLRLGHSRYSMIRVLDVGLGERCSVSISI